MAGACVSSVFASPSRSAPMNRPRTLSRPDAGGHKAKGAAAQTPGTDLAQGLDELMVKACNDSAAMMTRLVDQTREAFDLEMRALRENATRDDLRAAYELPKHKNMLAERMPRLLREELRNDLASNHDDRDRNVRIDFDSLELLDEESVQKSLAMARAVQVCGLKTDAELADLNSLVCAAQGLDVVQLERNPFRPEVYLRALQRNFLASDVPEPIAVAWFKRVGGPLSEELKTAYPAMVKALRQRGVKRAAYVVTSQAQAPGSAAPSASANEAEDTERAPLDEPMGTPMPAARQRVGQPLVHFRQATHTVQDFHVSSGLGLNSGPAMAYHQSGPMMGYAHAAPLNVAPAHDTSQRLVLTLEQLQWLLAASPAPDSGATYTSWTASTGAPIIGVDSTLASQLTSGYTLPAGLSSHAAMAWQRRREGIATGFEPTQSAGLPGDPEQDEEALPDIELERLVSQEVVLLMLQNVLNDARLLAPVRKLVRSLEPALRQLSQVEPRFFIVTDHPARALLENITYRSFAYPNDAAPGFNSFMEHLSAKIDILLKEPIDNAQPFQRALEELHSDWDRQEQEVRKARSETVEVLRRAEERNVLAAEIAQQIMERPDIVGTPTFVFNFLCGPWSQVLAHARLNDLESQVDDVLEKLLWSVNVEKAHKDMPGLLKAIPKLSTDIGHGLALIEYPAASIDDFLKALSAMHRRVLLERQRKGVDKAPAPAEKLQVPADPPAAPGLWLAPSERKLAGLATSSATEARTRRSAKAEKEPVDAGADTRPMVGSDTVQAGATESTMKGAPSTVPLSMGAAGPASTNSAPLSVGASSSDESQPPRAPMPTLGAWFEVNEGGQRYRAQLNWASPQGTLFLFIKADGTSYSMTRRIYDRKMDDKSLQLISGRAVVADALEAVTTQAKRNSEKGFGGIKDIAIV